jgi:hypothetical protein
MICLVPSFFEKNVMIDVAFPDFKDRKKIQANDCVHFHPSNPKQRCESFSGTKRTWSRSSGPVEISP